MRFFILCFVISTSASSVMAGDNGVPLQGAGIAGPVALLAAISAIAGFRYLRNRR